MVYDYKIKKNIELKHIVLAKIRLHYDMFIDRCV